MRQRVGLLGVLFFSSTGCLINTPGAGYARAYAGSIPLTLVNDTGVPACFVHMSPSSDTNWGDDWLGPTENIPPGGSRTFMVGGGPGWDIQILTCQRTQLSAEQHLPVYAAMQLPISTLRPTVYAQPPTYPVAQPAYPVAQPAYPVAQPAYPAGQQPVYQAPPPVY